MEAPLVCNGIHLFRHAIDIGQDFHPGILIEPDIQIQHRFNRKDSLLPVKIRLNLHLQTCQLTVNIGNHHFPAALFLQIAAKRNCALIETDRIFLSLSFIEAALVGMDTGEDKPDGHPKWFGLANFEPYRKAQETLVIPYKVPEAQPAGALNLDIRGGGLVPATALMLLQQSGVDVAAQDDKKKTTADKLKEFQKTGRNNEIIIAPGPAPEMTPKQKREAVRAAKRAAAENLAKARTQSRKVNLLGVNTKKPQSGETKFTTKYIIDNVLHTTLQVVRK